MVLESYLHEHLQSPGDAYCAANAKTLQVALQTIQLSCAKGSSLGKASGPGVVRPASWQHKDTL